MNADITCIVPVYNGERFLGETLESILAQSHPIQEVIIVDDGSTDSTRAVVEAYISKSDQRVRYLWQENSGAATARNLGIQTARGDFIAFQDADDLWHPEKTARQFERFAARPELAISVTHIQNFWMAEVRDEEVRMQGHARTQPMAGYVVQSFLARRSVFDQVGLFDATLQHTDFANWFLRAQEHGIVVDLLPEVLVYRRLHRNNRSRELAHNSRQEYLQLLHKARARQRAQMATVPV